MDLTRPPRILPIAILLLTIAIVFAFTPGAWGANLSWSEVQLVDASGVPKDSIHGYAFKGILKLYGTKPTESGIEFAAGFVPVYMESGGEKVLLATIWAKGKGEWDEKKNEAEERIVFEGDVAGEFYSLLKCTKDPWISATDCTVIKAQYKSTKGKIWDFPGMVQKWRLPISKPAVTLAKAEELSKKHTSSSPPPPPPKVLIKEEPPPTVSAKPVFPIIVPESNKGLTPAIEAKTSPGSVAVAPKPNLLVTGVQVKIEPNCQSPQPAMTAMVTIRNSGGALPANKGSVFIKEQGGTNLSSGGIPIPAIGSGQTQVVNIPAITLQPYSSLGGSHKIQVIMNPVSEDGQLSFNKPADPYLFVAVFPSGHCKTIQQQMPPVPAVPKSGPLQRK